VKLEQVLAQWARRAPTPGAAAAAPRESLSGRWRNEYGSVAEFAVEGERVNGTYTSQVGAAAKPLVGPITGFVRGDTVAFAVLWPAQSHSITSWVGQIVDVNGAPELRTLWHLVADIPDTDEPTGLWSTIHTGADTFRPLAEATKSHPGTRSR